MSSQEPYDVIVIGAGISGIASARFFLDIHPKCRLIIIERDKTVGGTWSAERVYPGFKAQASTRMCEFSDLPLTTPPGGSDENDCPWAKHVTEYLETYIDKHVYDGKPLRDRFNFNAIVTMVKKENNTWAVQFDQSGQQKQLHSHKLIVATGVTSIPNMPTIKGQDAFQAPMVHSIDFGRSWPALLEPSIKKIAVLGAGKSSADMVYQFAKAGKHVSWIIRKTGKGPGALIPSKGPGPYRNVNEIARTRFFTSLFLSGLRTKTWWDWLLWNTWPGQVFQKWFDNMAANVAAKGADFDGRTDAREGFKLLRNESKPNYLASPAGMLHYEDFWETIAKNVDVIRRDIDMLEFHKIVFTDGTQLESDALMFGTGYVEKFPFFSDADCIKLGLPHDRGSEHQEETEKWTYLEKAAEKGILARYPVLAHPPGIPEHFGDIDMMTTPYRLYHGVGTLNRDRSIAFVGFAFHPNMFEAAEIESIWATAFLDGVVKLPDTEAMNREIAYNNAYMRLRVPTYGRGGNYYVFDSFAHYEKLLDQDLGLTSWHPKGWWAYWTHPYLPANLKGLKEEYLEKYGDEIKR